MKRSVFFNSILLLLVLGLKDTPVGMATADVYEEPAVKEVKAIYPKEAYENKIEGQVAVTALIGNAGVVETVRVVKSTNEIFNRATVEAAKQWLFKPVVFNKKAVKFKYNILMVFKLVKKDPLSAITQPEVEILKDLNKSIFGEIQIVDKGPVLVQRVEPKYPPIARTNKIPGLVVLALLVDSVGRVEKYIILGSSNKIFNDEAVAVAKQYLFNPAIYSGKPTKSWFTDSVFFRIK